MPGRRVDDTVDWSRFDNHRSVQAAGQGFHQEALESVSGLSGPGRYECSATLVREPTNPHDPNAVQVVVDGEVIGHLKRGTAKKLNKRLLAMESAGASASYPAFIKRELGSQLSAHLQIPYDSELLKGYKNPKAKKR